MASIIFHRGHGGTVASTPACQPGVIGSIPLHDRDFFLTWPGFLGQLLGLLLGQLLGELISQILGQLLGQHLGQPIGQLIGQLLDQPSLKRAHKKCPIK